MVKNWKLGGIVPPVITPLLANDRLDVQGFENVLERMIAARVSAIFVLGTTGEAQSLNYALRREVVREAARIIRGRVPMLVGITDTVFEESLAQANFAAEQGADALVVAPPYYFPPSGDDLKLYYAHVVKCVPLPVVVYHMPELTKVWFSYDFVRFAVQTPEIIGMKDSSGNMDFFWRSCQIARQAAQDFPILVGPEHLLQASFSLGGSGGVSGGANLFPEFYVGMCKAVAEGNVPLMDEFQRKIDRVNDIYAVASGGMGVCRGIKCALHYMGFCSDLTAEPFHPLKEEERLKIEQITEELKH